MAVKEFLDAVDKKKKAEEASIAAPVSAEVAPVSAEVAPVAAAQIPNIPLEQALIQTSRDIVEYGKSGDAAPTILGTPAPMESVVDTVGQAPAVQSPFSQTAAAEPNTTAAAVAPVAQPDVLAAAPAVQASAIQAPSGQGTMLATPEAPTAATEVKAPGVLDTITENFAESKLGKFFGGMTTYDVSRGGDVVSGSGNPVFPNLAEKTGTPAYGASDIPVPPVVEMATPDSVANLSVNGTNTVTPEAITEAGQAAPVAVAPQVPQVGSGGMITRDLTGESFIGGSRTAATPEEVAAFNKMSLAANTDAAARERMRYNAPTIAAQAEKAAAVQAERDQPKAPVRLTEQERKLKEKRSEATFRKEAKKDIRAKVRDFGQTNSMAKTREFERSLNKKLESDVIANRDYNRATEEADLAAATAQYNRETLTGAQRATLGKQTANEQKLSSIRAANPSLSDADAAAIAAGAVRVVQNPLSGETQLLNIATGESQKVGAEQGTDVDFDVAVPEKTLYGRIGQFTGAVEGTKRKLQALGGQVGVDVATDESLEAAQDFKAAQNQLVRAFKQSDRYSATESKQLKEELGIDLSLFEDPKTAEAKLRSADQTLARNYENEIATYQDTSFPSKDRQDARLRAKAIAEFRALIGVPEKGATPVEVKFDPKSLTGKNQQAYGWATSNPNDPRSQAILAKLNLQ